MTCDVYKFKNFITPPRTYPRSPNISSHLLPATNIYSIFSEHDHEMPRTRKASKQNSLLKG